MSSFRSQMVAGTLLLIAVTAMGVVRPQSDPPGPFPQNRVRNFYSQQAERVLDGTESPGDGFLPQFPGLDGGRFGHWGQNPEEASFDYTLNDVQTGNVVCQLTSHFGSRTPKAVNVRLDGAETTTVLFDPVALTFRDSWRGGFVHWDHVRFGLMAGVRPVGRRWLDWSGSRWAVAGDHPFHYRGFHRRKGLTVFEYSLNAASILDCCRDVSPFVVRQLHIRGALPENTRLTLMKMPESAESAIRLSDNVVRIPMSDGDLLITLQSEPGGARLSSSDQEISIVFDPAVTMQHVTIGLASAERAHELPRPPVVSPLPDPDALREGSPGEWTGQTAITGFCAGTSDGPVTLDTFTLPQRGENAFGSTLRLGGLACLPDGRIAVSTLMGEVWTVTPPAELVDGAPLKWQRMAAGLYQPLGLVAEGRTLLVLGGDQITRLHDFNADGEADFYECVTNQYPTTGGHDFCTSLQADQSGRLYWSVASGDFGIARRSLDGRIESLGNGLRNCNGIGVSSDGGVVLASAQEGTWTPASALFEVRNGSYHGLKGPRAGHGEYGYDLPLCFLPRGVDNSSGEVRFLPRDQRLGPLSGAAVGTSYGNCSAYAVLRDVVNGVSQGAAVPLPADFISGVCRVTFREQDGCVYFAGTEGWQSYASQPGGLQRLRLTGRPWILPSAIEAWNNGLLIRFTDRIDRDSLSPARFLLQQWNYLYSAAYGSPEYSVRDPGRQAHDVVPVKAAHLLADGRSVFLEIPELHPVMQMHVHGRLSSEQGTPFILDAYASIHQLRPDFTDLPGYAPVAKPRAPRYPVAGNFAQDPRLVRQESLGADFGWVSSATKLSVSAAPGLQFEPRVLRVAPGSRVSLGFHNQDPGMPHNVAIVAAADVDAFGEAAMLMASNPRAVANHYVPDMPPEICFSPILPPGDQYTVFFEAPREPGEYRLVCTYPGHWRVMQGSLFVLPDDAPLPPTAFTPSRKFVRMWTVDDLGDAADTLAQRNFLAGREVFESAGCIKCHRIARSGAALGPDLTKVAERFTGRKLLKQILEPSAELNPQYQSWSAIQVDGRVVTGLMAAQSDSAITLLPNPLQPDSLVTIPRDRIEELTASPVSTMPGSLLITFSEDEILDLLAFVQSGGDATHSVFAR